jgi:hypothetical protein
MMLLMNKEWFRPDDEEVEQRHADEWAMRILNCPKAKCRRGRDCRARPTASCLGWSTLPSSKEHLDAVQAAFRRWAVRCLEETENPDGPAKGCIAARYADMERRKKLAFERAEAKLRKGRVMLAKQ